MRHVQIKKQLDLSILSRKSQLLSSRFGLIAIRAAITKTDVRTAVNPANKRPCNMSPFTTRQIPCETHRCMGNGRLHSPRSMVHLSMSDRSTIHFCGL